MVFEVFGFLTEVMEKSEKKVVTETQMVSPVSSTLFVSLTTVGGSVSTKVVSSAEMLKSFVFKV